MCSVMSHRQGQRAEGNEAGRDRAPVLAGRPGRGTRGGDGFGVVADSPKPISSWASEEDTWREMAEYYFSLLEWEWGRIDE